jgi:hypothetical protein
MPETRQITFSYQEVAEALVKRQGFHEGLWGVFVEFGLAAGNVPSPEGNIVPAAILPVQRMGIQRFDEEIKGLTVDASVVNPAPTSLERSPGADEA